MRLSRLRAGRGLGGGRQPASEQDALPHGHLLVVSHPDHADHRPDSQPQAPAGPGHHVPGAFPERAVRANALGSEAGNLTREWPHHGL